MEKKKHFSLLKFLIILICFISIAFSAGVNVLFAGGKTPVILDNYIYIVKETDNMGDFITTGAALISPSAKNSSIAKGDIVICHPADAPDTLKILSIYQIDIGDDGIARFTTTDASDVPSENTITKESIAAICTGHTQSLELGNLITFAMDIKGIIALLIIPCVILIIFLIAKIVAAKDDDEVPEEDYDFYEYDGEKKKNQPVRASHEKKSSAPLFEPSHEIQPSDDLERKKMSIAENFSQKRSIRILLTRRKRNAQCSSRPRWLQNRISLLHLHQAHLLHRLMIHSETRYSTSLKSLIQVHSALSSRLTSLLSSSLKSLLFSQERAVHLISPTLSARARLMHERKPLICQLTISSRSSRTKRKSSDICKSGQLRLSFCFGGKLTLLPSA